MNRRWVSITKNKKENSLKRSRKKRGKVPESSVSVVFFYYYESELHLIKLFFGEDSDKQDFWTRASAPKSAQFPNSFPILNSVTGTPSSLCQNIAFRFT